MSPPTAKSDTPQEALTFLDIVTFWLSVYVMIALLAEYLLKLSEDTRTILAYADWIVCGVFFLDFSRRFIRASSKLEFMKWGWLDLLACIPVIEAFRAGRLYRLIRVLRLLRVVRSSRNIARILYRRRAQNAFAVVATTTFVGTVLAAIIVMEFERDSSSRISHPSDAIWWAFCTVTTVGYGDYYPVTTEGRVTAVALMTLGVGMFGTMAGYVASMFTGPSTRYEAYKLHSVENRLEALQKSVERLEKLLQDQRKQ
ncbi:voltage-gated potassium channel [Roseimicrobium gellanilyticum]|uniref:Voltage-gated potassium channel n=1 Tax=Roseimicrobium gellanilyticum TaxID=748857 RepID=A0A366HUP0_9BACT|nr:potassium channel family protein [Roseimicrobium gellanilyticum]RBP47399.1 voltage-gated potassium channel [Roseimicrobium gellanilyticum]